MLEIDFFLILLWNCNIVSSKNSAPHCLPGNIWDQRREVFVMRSVKISWKRTELLVFFFINLSQFYGLQSVQIDTVTNSWQKWYSKPIYIHAPSTPSRSRQSPEQEFKGWSSVTCALHDTNVLYSLTWSQQRRPNARRARLARARCALAGWRQLGPPPAAAAGVAPLAAPRSTLGLRWRPSPVLLALSWLPVQSDYF